MPFDFNTSINASLVNWLPWSVLNISGRPYFSIASFKASGSEIHPCRCCLCSLVGTRRRHNYSHCLVASWAKA
nr:hypothetical protein [Escherichia coli]